MKILITGGAGFISHHFVEHFLNLTDWDIVIFDNLTYAANGYDRLRDIECYDNPRIQIFPIDLSSEISDGVVQEVGNVEYIINLASESHVDNSIEKPAQFIQNNVNLTRNLLEWSRKLPSLKKFVQFSTDEVHGTAPKEVEYKEGNRHNPGNPYAASKSAQESICRAYANTHKLPIIITNTMNAIGERQHEEKFVPLVIHHALNGTSVSIHANSSKTKAGTRFYAHARNVADAVYNLLLNSEEKLDNVDASKGQYNIVGEREIKPSRWNLPKELNETLRKAVMWPASKLTAEGAQS